MPDEKKRTDEERIPDPAQRAAALAVHDAIRALFNAQGAVRDAAGDRETFRLSLAPHVFDLWWALVSTSPWDGGPVEVHRGIFVHRAGTGWGYRRAPIEVVDASLSVEIDCGPIPSGTECAACGTGDSPGYIRRPLPTGFDGMLCNQCDADRAASTVIDILPGGRFRYLRG